MRHYTEIVTAVLSCCFCLRAFLGAPLRAKGAHSLTFFCLWVYPRRKARCSKRAVQWCGAAVKSPKGFRGVACCDLRKLVFETLDEFPDDTPGFSNIVGAFASKRCRAAISTAQRVEDVEATDDASLFDEAGYLVGLCGKHSALVI